MKQHSLNSLEKRCTLLNSKLIHQQFKSGQIPLKFFRKYSLRIIEEYKQSKSLFKASQRIGIDFDVVMSWYVGGQRGIPQFRAFYLVIEDINKNLKSDDVVGEVKLKQEKINVEEFPNDYIISQYGDGWSYKTYVDGEKIFIISNELDTLKQKVKNQNLPIE